MKRKTTDLCARLAARGVEYKLDNGVMIRGGHQDLYTEWQGKGGVQWIYNEVRREGVTVGTKLTHRGPIEPEQAVEATLGPVVDNDACDGCCIFDELYDQRTGLLAAFCSTLVGSMIKAGRSRAQILEVFFKSHRHHDGSMYDGYFIVGVNCAHIGVEPDRWATFYCQDKWWTRFLVPSVELATESDVDTTEDAMQRLLDKFTTTAFAMQEE